MIGVPPRFGRLDEDLPPDWQRPSICACSTQGSFSIGRSRNLISMGFELTKARGPRSRFRRSIGTIVPCGSTPNFRKWTGRFCLEYIAMALLDLMSTLPPLRSSGKEVPDSPPVAPDIRSGISVCAESGLLAKACQHWKCHRRLCPRTRKRGRIGVRFRGVLSQVRTMPAGIHEFSLQDQSDIAGLRRGET